MDDPKVSPTHTQVVIEVFFVLISLCACCRQNTHNYIVADKVLMVRLLQTAGRPALTAGNRGGEVGSWRERRRREQQQQQQDAKRKLECFSFPDSTFVCGNPDINLRSQD